MKQRLTVDGRPVCGAGCRWPRGECPTHPMPQTAHAHQVLTEVEAYLPSLAQQHQRHRGLVGALLGDDATCGGCGYHVCACAAKAPARLPSGPFVAGDLLRKVTPAADVPGLPKLPKGWEGRATRVGVWRDGALSIPYVIFADTPKGRSYRADSFELVEPAPAPRATAG